MTITIDVGKKAATVMAKTNVDAYEKVSQRHGTVLDKYRGVSPRVLSIAHVLRINPSVITNPTYEGRDDRGFMKVSIEDARASGVDWDKMGDPEVAAYVWLSNFNLRASALSNTHGKLFSEYGEDFWRTVYLRQSLGDALFDYIWNTNVPTIEDDTVYGKLLYTVNINNKTAYNLTAERLKVLVFKEIEFTYQLASIKGNLFSDKPGEVLTPYVGDYPALYNRSTL